MDIIDFPGLSTYDIRTVFSALIKSCNGRRSLFPPNAGIVELCAILVAADRNILYVLTLVREVNDDCCLRCYE